VSTGPKNVILDFPYLTFLSFIVYNKNINLSYMFTFDLNYDFYLTIR